MNKETRHRIAGDELRATLERLLGRRVIRLRRRLCDYASSYTVENLDVIVAPRTQLRLVVKDVSPPAVLATAQQIRPHFLYDPVREIEIYQKVLDPARHGTARCIGAVNSPNLERHWLFLERVDSHLLWQVGDLSRWDAAARWLAEFHSTQGARSAGRRCKSLLNYDREFFGVWIERAEKFLSRQRAADLQKFKRLSRNYDRLVRQLSALPTTFIHGEFYASNIIVRREPKRPICAIDWEVAGIGPGALDLATLTAGEWSEAEKRRFISAYRDALGSPGAISTDDLLQAVDLCQLHLSVQMLGWAEEWSPPEQHAQNWLREALRLANKLGLT